jgi:LacI family transcriptional regulator
MKVKEGVAMSNSAAEPRDKLPKVAVMIKLDYSLSHHIQVFSGIQRYAATTGRWRVVIDPFAYQQVTGDGDGYAGVIGRATSQLAEQAERHGVPAVNVWARSPVARRLPSVFPDGESVGRMAAEHLLRRGLTRFGVLWSRGNKISGDMLDGFRQRLRKSNFDCTDCHVPHGMFDSPAAWRTSRESIARWMGELSPAVGVFALPDRLANTLADLCTTEFDIDIPHDVALVGAGNERAYCDNPWMPITSIDMNYGEIGWQAAELLDKLMNGAAPPTEPIRIDPKELVPRQSTDVTAVDDAEVAAAMRFIANNCNEPIQVQDVADAIAMSRRTLQRRFRAMLGRSISDQIQFLRLQRFKRMLLDSKEPVKAVAVQCGFSNFQHLYRAFVRTEGVPPNQYRRERSVNTS